MTAITNDNLAQAFRDVFGDDIDEVQKHLEALKLRDNIDAANAWAAVVRDQAQRRQARSNDRIQAAEAEAQTAEDAFNAFVEDNFADPSAGA